MFNLQIEKKLLTNTTKKEKGQSLVEMALVFTTLMFMLSILVDIGRVFFALIALNDAAQEGATFASMNPSYNEYDEPTSWPETIDRIVNSSSAPIDFDAELTNGNFRVGHPAINGCTHHDWWCPTNDDCSGFDSNENANTVNVSVSYDFEFIMPLMDTIVPGGMLTLSAQADSTIVYPPCD